MALHARIALPVAVAALALSTAFAGRIARGEEATLRAYRAARVVTGLGKTFEPGVVVVRGGSVEAVLDGEGKIPQGAEVVDLGESVVVPGFVNPLSSVASTPRRSGVARQSGGQPSDGRRNEAAKAVKLEAVIHRRLGRTPYGAYAWLPTQQGLFAGQSAVLRPATGRETDAEELVLGEKAFLLMNFALGRQWRDAARNELKKAADAVAKAREDAAKKPAEAKKGAAEANSGAEGGDSGNERRSGRGPPARRAGPGGAQPAPPKTPPPPDPLVEVMKGKLRLVVRLSSPAILDHFFVIYDELPIKPRLVVVLPSLPPELIARLKPRKKQIEAVILDPEISLLWETSIALNSVRFLLESGFDVALVPDRDDPDGMRRMPFRLAQLLKGGIEEKQALDAVTRIPARILGLEGKVGVLDKGALANFVVFRGDPLGGTARLLRVFVSGTEVFLDDLESGELYGEAIR